MTRRIACKKNRKEKCSKYDRRHGKNPRGQSRSIQRNDAEKTCCDAWKKHEDKRIKKSSVKDGLRAAIFECLAHAHRTCIGKGGNGDDHHQARNNGHGEQSWKKPCALQQVKQDRPVENHQQDEGKNTVRSHAAVLHDFQHALARASRKQSVHRVHEAVAMKPTRQENRQYQQDCRNDMMRQENAVLRQKTQQQCGKGRINDAEHQADQRKITHAVGKILLTPILLLHDRNAREKLQTDEKRTQKNTPSASCLH